VAVEAFEPLTARVRAEIEVEARQVAAATPGHPGGAVDVVLGA
jgi:hypothetical protein